MSDPFVGSVILVAVAATMIWHSLRYRSQAVTAVAYFTAFAALAVTPSSPFAVLGLLPLAASLLYLSWRFEWHSMALYGLAATYLTCISRGNSDAPLTATQTLFLAYWLLFEAFDLLRIKRRIAAVGQDLLFPVNALCFLGLSYLTWSAHAPGRLWVAAGFGAALFLADSLLRAAVGGRFEYAFLFSAVLAGLSIVGRVPGVWAGVWLAVEAEIIYLAGIRLRSDFLRGVGVSAFLASVLKSIGSADASRITALPGGHDVRNWEPPLLFDAMLFYLNRRLMPNVAMSSCAAAIVAAILLAEVSLAGLGLALTIFGLVLFEVGLRKSLTDFRVQGAFVLLSGVIAAALGIIDRGAWIGHAVCIALIYVTAVRTRWMATLDPEETERLALGLFLSTAVLSVLLAWRLAPEPYLAAALQAISIAFLITGIRFENRYVQLQAHGIATIAFFCALVKDINPPQLWAAGLTAGGFYGAQYLSKHYSNRVQSWAPVYFSVLGTFLVGALLYNQASGGLLTVSWGIEGVLLLSFGFALHERILRLQGLGLLMTCILKLFLYDLRNLETVYRILSFVVLGLILLGVSWIYSRFREKVLRLL